MTQPLANVPVVPQGSLVAAIPWTGAGEDIVRCAFRHFDQDGSGNVSPEILTEVPWSDGW